MEIKSRICRASLAGAARQRTPSRCPTCATVPAGLARLLAAGTAPASCAAGSALPRARGGQSAGAARSWVGAVGTVAPRTRLPLRYPRPQPQGAPAARGRRERSLPSPPAQEGGGGGGDGCGDPAAPGPGRTSGRAHAQRGPDGAVRACGGCSPLRTAACCARHQQRRSSAPCETANGGRGGRCALMRRELGSRACPPCRRSARQRLRSADLPGPHAVPRRERSHNERHRRRQVQKKDLSSGALFSRSPDSTPTLNYQINFCKTEKHKLAIIFSKCKSIFLKSTGKLIITQ